MISFAKSGIALLICKSLWHDLRSTHIKLQTLIDAITELTNLDIFQSSSSIWMYLCSYLCWWWP